jgi:hypothetical protein
LCVVFPPGQTVAEGAYVRGFLQYTGFHQASAAIKASQNVAIQQWLAGQDAPGRQIGQLRVPTLVADGTLDQLDPTANDRLLAAGPLPRRRPCLLVPRRVEVSPRRRGVHRVSNMSCATT